MIAVGVNHSSATLALRERLSIAATGPQLQLALAALQSRGVQGFILSTCGRTELYAYPPDHVDAVELYAQVLSTGAPLHAEELRESCYVHTGSAGAEHALRVASGLDSIVLGEDQIHTQLKKSVAVARDAGTLGPVMDRLASAALSCSKRVRTLTGLSRHAVSLESLALRAATERVGALAGKHVLIIGAGDSAAIILKQLGDRDAAAITIVSRTVARATELARTHGAHARGAYGSAELAEALTEADVVFCCTSAPHPVVTPELLAPRQHERADAPLLCVDLGMPRDVHPDVHALGVDVIALDALQTLADAHRASRREHIPAA
ncbi:MAG TPA: glutamyl-tRNA reductase, partial [Gemmatimonadaceae bacterium]|nr:glutamyl-tRNA reductase [Gemmatimonadaceae bacterium]